MLPPEILNKPLISMTGSEILELFGEIISKNDKPQVNDFTGKNLVYGIKGLADLLKCGKSKAQEIKSSGIIDEAIIQTGKKIIIDSEKAIDLLKKNSPAATEDDE
ncbi:DUF3853 family protein [Chryseobacterium defluvii]|uniref:Uncharacterized protein DUF3853 n=1 Tax=Chryseobacterium defluvii TaxID=160396 RepID=A0A495SNN7_9FLAO|nr:DUF3853 family protein [Chryseobacterium defluvii]RKT01050.1 uncharacterized protein DUF3853 [Chryseobacterium defluvii]